MKEGRNQQDWIREVANPRESFGKSVMRELQRAEFSTTVRGAPSGKYVTVIYLTQFANAPPVYEAILLTLEDDRWRIAGYSIDRAPERLRPRPPPPKKTRPGCRFEAQGMSVSAPISNVRPQPDQVLVDIADYVDELQDHERRGVRHRPLLPDGHPGLRPRSAGVSGVHQALGPIVPGTVVPNGARVPGTQFELDPVKAAFNIGA